MTRRRIAVVGSGVAGLTAAYVLQHEADVTLYEADDRLGGHADTHEVLRRATACCAASTPASSCTTSAPTRRCVRLFAELGVATQESDMSMSISCARLRARVRRRPRVRRTAAVAAVGDQPALPADAARGRPVPRPRDGAAGGSDDDTADGPRVHRARAASRRYFTAHFMTPLIAAVWSTAPDAGRRLPGPLPVRVPAQPRHAQRHRRADLVHRRRRLRPATSSGPRRA